jgi:hypothetical protein
MIMSSNKHELIKQNEIIAEADAKIAMGANNLRKEVHLPMKM